MHLCYVAKIKAFYSYSCFSWAFHHTIQVHIKLYLNYNFSLLFNHPKWEKNSLIHSKSLSKENTSINFAQIFLQPQSKLTQHHKILTLLIKENTSNNSTWILISIQFINKHNTNSYMHISLLNFYSKTYSNLNLVEFTYLVKKWLL